MWSYHISKSILSLHTQTLHAPLPCLTKKIGSQLIPRVTCDVDGMSAGKQQNLQFKAKFWKPTDLFLLNFYLPSNYSPGNPLRGLLRYMQVNGLRIPFSLKSHLSFNTSLIFLRKLNYSPIKANLHINFDPKKDIVSPGLKLTCRIALSSTLLFL